MQLYKKVREQMYVKYGLGKKWIIPVLNTGEVFLGASILRDTHTECSNRYTLYPVIGTGDSFFQEWNVECVRVLLASSIHPYSRKSRVAGYKGSGAIFGFYQCMV